jgi:hypothetical protein
MGRFVQSCACLRCSDFRILKLFGDCTIPKTYPLTDFLAQAREDLWLFVDFIKSYFARLNLGSLITCRGYYDAP